ncbi:uncharacterized protein B0I36DRAFT_347700 [Microdochium trichocladiopsis]|uniref:F-box domain-containing protein n=1 Tax=Microdochium trichocladiopsis TaxID=1682393 RepID=A0A9P8YCK2_9PEZI|nr:uncharacterized protein B0I36DRAFT_347700 [Microdochium trichocladiopsis]KAH7035993.1 hypothetical protein B0I36DRAFT_347700 [Microdochium trichocladiopsis]
MDRLSQELYDTIVSYVARISAVASLASVSHRWRVSVERRTFREIHLKSSELDFFEHICRQRPDRQQYIRTIQFSIILPTYDQEKRGLFESDEDRAANDRAFTIAIIRLLDILSHWPSENGHLKLRLEEVYSVADRPSCRGRWAGTDVDIVPGTHTRIDADGTIHTVTDLYEWRYFYSFLDLDRKLVADRGHLPEVPVIREFYLGPTARNIADHVSVILAAQCMPNLSVAMWRLVTWEIKYLRLRRAYRSLLSQAIMTHFLDLNGLKELVIQMGCPNTWWADNFIEGDISRGPSTRTSYWPDDQAGRAEESGQARVGSDNLSSALRIGLTQLRNLKRLILSGTFDATLFTEEDPSAVSLEGGIVEQSQMAPCWGEALEYLHVSFDARRPQGGSYFRMAGPVRFASDLDDIEQRNDLSTEEEFPPGYGSLTPEAVQAATQAFAMSDHTAGSSSADFPVAAVDDDDMGISSLLAGFARACARMPKLKRSSISSWIPARVLDEAGERVTTGRRMWGVWYVTPDLEADESIRGRAFWFRSPAFFGDVKRRRVLWDTQDWRPSEQLSSLFAIIGREKYACDFVESFASTDGIRALERYRKSKDDNEILDMMDS